MNPHHPDEGNSHEHELVMPFVATSSHGGPYEDDAFVAGWAANQLDQILQLASGAMVGAVHATVRVALVPQLDLIGMRWGYTTTVEPIVGNSDWCRLYFTALTHIGEEDPGERGRS